MPFSQCYLNGEHIRRHTSQQGLAYLWEQHKGVFVGRSQGRFRLWSVNIVEGTGKAERRALGSLTIRLKQLTWVSKEGNDKSNGHEIHRASLMCQSLCEVSLIRATVLDEVERDSTGHSLSMTELTLKRRCV